MNILRMAAHTLLAAPFVIDGISVVRDPDDHAEKAERAWSTVSAWGAPELDGDQLRLIARAGGAVLASLGVHYALGQNRRTTAAVLAASTLPLALINAPIWLAGDKAERRAAAKSLTNYGVLAGGLILGALDRNGKPSRKWKRAQAQTLQAAASGK